MCVSPPYIVRSHHPLPYHINFSLLYLLAYLPKKSICILSHTPVSTSRPPTLTYLSITALPRTYKSTHLYIQCNMFIYTGFRLILAFASCFRNCCLHTRVGLSCLHICQHLTSIYSIHLTHISCRLTYFGSYSQYVYAFIRLFLLFSACMHVLCLYTCIIHTQYMPTYLPFVVISVLLYVEQCVVCLCVCLGSMPPQQAWGTVI